ncbi:MAG TPA: APC family permease [Desulfovibrio sp.]|uniref:APC family permease n=1 Tax=Desulfovibrio sp. TaxID=885 RepID=UPI002A4A1FAA|nr:APC family permease [Desulfovibrio sp.]MDY0306991.1 APC family permease [Desulfovibrionaceae bacterium]HMM38059.1 APC family permease [Desulfovibrio sp.]
MSRSSLTARFRALVLGRPLDPEDRGLFHKLALASFLAWVGLGADPLSSSCYGPSEAFLALGGHHALSLFVALATVVTVCVISASYTQIIDLFPTGGGGYLVAGRLLSPSVGMVSGCALLIDYVLTITLSIASGADAVFSFLPPSWQGGKLAFALAGVILLTVLNLRGVKESVSVLVPIFLAFLVGHVFLILYGLGQHLDGLPEIVSRAAADVGATQRELGFWGMIALILRAYAMGAGTYTGLEAVSNGLPVLREPRARTGKRTMLYMALSLSFMVVGLILNYMLHRVEFQPGKTLNAVLFGAMTSSWGVAGPVVVSAVLVTEAAILFVAAQAGFLDGPRILANMALDRWAPAQFAHLSDRLVTQNGILLMGGAALVLMEITGGSVEVLLVLYSINVFVTFILSQAGMVRHWWQARGEEPHWRKGLLLNGLGLVLTGFILATIVAVKFFEGGWATLVVTGALAGAALLIRRHYRRVGALVRKLDGLKQAVEEDMSRLPDNPEPGDLSAPAGSLARTAVVLVSGYNGLGLHSLLAIHRRFPGEFSNYVFLCAGAVDAGVYRGKREMEELRDRLSDELGQYVRLMRRRGYHAESVLGVGTDAVEVIAGLAEEVAERYPWSVFFAGQLVFPRESFWSRLLHNQVVFGVQRRLLRRALPFTVLPVTV